MSNEPVSIIIPAYNCEKTISQTLQAVLAQNYSGPMEVVVVDDGSKDDTARIIKSFSKIKYVRQENAGPAAARNRGVEASQNAFLFFTDSDCVPDPDWVRKIMARFSETKIAVVSGTYGLANPKSLLARCVHQEIIFRHKSLMPQVPKSFGSYNFCLRRKVYEEVHGFNPEYRQASGEDNDLSYKIIARGYWIYFEKDAVVKHFHTTQLQKYLFEQYRHGFWRAKMYKDHPRMSVGDDYTFWKDILEIPLVLISFSCTILSAVSTVPAMLASTALFSLAVIELFYGLIIMKNVPEGLFLAMVMFLRAWSRAAGFIHGIFYFLPQKSAKKS